MKKNLLYLPLLTKQATYQAVKTIVIACSFINFLAAANAQTPVFTSSMSPTCLNGCSSPANEGVKMVLDGKTSTKFLDFKKLNTGFQVNTNAASVVTKIEITTANDFPERDPKSFTLQGSNNGTTWTNIYNGTMACNASRFAKQSFNITNSTSYSWYKFIVNSLCNATTAEAMQVAEVQIFKSTAPLPIKLISFDGQVKNNRAELSWAIAQPEENATYEIQHSLNGQQFTPVSKIFNNNTNTRFNHTANLAAGTNYYRLKTTDKMGEVSYSNIISLKGNGTGSSVSIYPNPVKQGAPITLFANNKIFTNWTLYNMYGQKVATQAGTFTGNNILQLPAQLSKGQYMLHLSGNGDKMVTQVTVD